MAGPAGTINPAHQRKMQIAMQLHEQGRVAEAANLYQEVLREDPRNGAALYSLGFACSQNGQYDTAERLFDAATRLDPRHLDPWYNRGIALYRLQRRAEALTCFDWTLAIDPGHYEALVNRAVVMLEMNHPAEALASCDTALALKPDFMAALVNRGNALGQLGRYQEALAVYDHALTLEPGNLQVRENRENTLFQLGEATRCPPGYMRRLFDEFSTDYDATMVDALGYRAHEHLRTLFDRLVPEATAPLRILDLGCGTGLVGDNFQTLAVGGRLDGIDLAPRMIDTARRRGIYTDLILGDLETELALSGETYDLILAADTMIYLGDLSPTFSGVARRLVPGGYYIFAVEAKEDEGWEQTRNNRFRHSLAYMREEAARAGLDFVDVMECSLRSEAKIPVAGYTVALRKSA
jgi:predicted TPR repeat methyltransferase